MDFAQIAILLSVAGVFGIIARTLRQPLLIGYLFAGLVLGALGLVNHTEGLASLGQIGVTLLLFLLGLEMKLSDLPSIGKVALLTGVGQIVFTSAIGFLLATVLGFDTLPSLYIAVALTFSSTIIMVKLLSEKKDLQSLYGKISVGFLLVQDVVAVLILMFLGSLGNGGLSGGDYLVLGAKALILFGLVWVLSKKVLPKFFDKFVATSPELLFIVSIAWALGVASLVAGPFGFTLEIGGFLAGLTLSNLSEHLQIASRTRPLRDFFLTIFFLLLGTQLAIGQSIGVVILPALLLSVFVLIGNPIIVMIIMGILGYKKRTSFLAGLTVAQISEFSFILLSMGAALGHVRQAEVSLVVLVGVITMTISTYMILGADKIYKVIGTSLAIFERKNPKEKALLEKTSMSDHVVLIGADRTGMSLVRYFRSKKMLFVVVDYNPKVFSKLVPEKIPVLFGDIADPDILTATRMEHSQMVISTTGNFEDNLTLLSYIKGLRRRPLVVVTAATKREAVKLYEAGADYVSVPEMVAGEHFRHLFATYGVGSSRLAKIGKSHFNRLLKL